MTFWHDINEAVKKAVARTRRMTEKQLREDWAKKQRQRGAKHCTVEEVRRLGR